MTTEELREIFTGYLTPGGITLEEVDAWLAGVQAAAWDEGYHDAQTRVPWADQPDDPGEFDNPYRQ